MSSRARFHIPALPPPGGQVLLQGDEYHHLRNVLRLKTGDAVSIFDGAGRGFSASVLEMDRRGALLKVEREEVPSPESPLRLHLAMALAKGEKLDLVIQKGTELGVVSFHPLATRRADLKLDPARAGSRLSRWRRVALEACKQSGRTLIPEIFPPATLDEFLARELPGTRIAFDPSGRPAAEFFHDGAFVIPASLLAAVGPEGGWSREELDRLQRSGFVTLRAGPRILRAETAAILAAGLLQYLAGDLGKSRAAPGASL